MPSTPIMRPNAVNYFWTTIGNEQPRYHSLEPRTIPLEATNIRVIEDPTQPTVIEDSVYEQELRAAHEELLNYSISYSDDELRHRPKPRKKKRVEDNPNYGYGKWLQKVEAANR